VEETPVKFDFAWDGSPMTDDVARDLLWTAMVYGLAFLIVCLFVAGGIAVIRAAWKGEFK
jgi:hypothetical protein